MGHRAPWINSCDALECLACLRVRHVMQQRHSMVEFRLGLAGTADSEM